MSLEINHGCNFCFISTKTRENGRRRRIGLGNYIIRVELRIYLQHKLKNKSLQKKMERTRGQND